MVIDVDVGDLTLQCFQRFNPNKTGLLLLPTRDGNPFPLHDIH